MPGPLISAETAKNAGLMAGTEIEKRNPDCVYFKFIHTDNKNLDRLCINESVIEAALRVGSSLSSEDFGSQESGEVMTSEVKRIHQKMKIQ